MTVTQPRRTCRAHSEAFKRSLIEASGEPGASVAGVALANGINANQLRCGGLRSGRRGLGWECIRTLRAPIVLLLFEQQEFAAVAVYAA